jgi:hypothetical protein
MVNGAAVPERNPQAVRDTIPVPVKLKKFIDEVFDLGAVRVRTRLAEHFLGDGAKQCDGVALDDSHECSSASPISSAR